MNKLVRNAVPICIVAALVTVIIETREKFGALLTKVPILSSQDDDSHQTNLKVRKDDWIIGYEIGDTGVTLDYPANLVSSIYGSRAYFEDRSRHGFSIDIFALQRTYENLQEWINAGAEGQFSANWQEQIIIEKNGANEVLSFKTPNTAYYLVHGNQLLVLSNGIDFQGEGTRLGRETVDQILSSIAFK